MKKILIVLSIILLSGCATTSPEVKQLLSKNGISELEVCRDSGSLAIECKGDKCVQNINECNPYHEISTEEANNYIAKKAEATRNAKAKSDAQMLANKKAQDERTAVQDAYEAKVKADKLAAAQSDEKINARISQLGVSDKEIIDKLRRNYDKYLFKLKETDKLTNEHLDDYIAYKERVKKEADQEKADAVVAEAAQAKAKAQAAEYEKNAKIHSGKQYICSDGNDSYVLKYNGLQITFGDVNFDMTLIGYFRHNRQQNMADMLTIDRVKATVTYRGNKTTCKPR